MSKNTTEADVAFISALAELLNKNDLTELSVKREYGEDDALEVRVVKQSNVVTMAAPAPVAAAITTATAGCDRPSGSAPSEKAVSVTPCAPACCWYQRSTRVSTSRSV